MAFSPLPSSSPSANPTSYKYDVFLNFRGEDTRKNFISHLYTALLREKIKTCYVYRDEIAEREGTLSSQSFRAIEESKLSIVVFSENYACSARCLEELAYILECRRKMGQVVVPVFYHIDPSDVRKQLGSYAAAFSFHEECLKHDRTDKLQQWRHALTEAGSLSGWDTSGLR